MQSVADVVEAIRLPTSSVRSRPTRFDHLPEEMKDDEDVLASVEALLGPSPVPVDEIIRL